MVCYSSEVLSQMFTKVAFVEVPSFCDGCCITTFTEAEVSGAQAKHIKLKNYALYSIIPML